MVLALSILIFLTIVVVVFAFGAATMAPSSVLGSRLREIGWQRPKAEAKPAMRERIQQALDPLSRALPVSPTDVSLTRAWLIQAGYREARHVRFYFASRVLFAALGLTTVILFTGFNSLLLLVGVPALGFFLPRFFLKRAMKERQRRIRLGLPDALDLTVICVEAGLALDQAMMRVGEDLQHAHPELSGEFHLFNLETRAGKRRPRRAPGDPRRPRRRCTITARSFKPTASEPASPKPCGSIPIPCAPSAASAPKSRLPKPLLK